MRFEIDWASLIVGGKFTVFALFYFVFEGKFPSTSPRGAYIWKGLFSEFYGTLAWPLQIFEFKTTIVILRYLINCYSLRRYLSVVPGRVILR